MRMAAGGALVERQATRTTNQARRQVDSAATLKPTNQPAKAETGNGEPPPVGLAARWVGNIVVSNVRRGLQTLPSTKGKSSP